MDKMSQYADDTVLFLDGSGKSMTSAFCTLETFANISRLKVNVEKNQKLRLNGQEQMQLLRPWE